MNKIKGIREHTLTHSYFKKIHVEFTALLISTETYPILNSYKDRNKDSSFGQKQHLLENSGERRGKHMICRRQRTVIS